MERDEALRLVYDAIDVINRQLPAAERLAKSPDTIIVGPSGRLDSLGIVNLIMAIEERAGDVIGTPVQLLDAGAFIDAQGPLRSVESVARLLQEAARG